VGAASPEVPTLNCTATGERGPTCFKARYKLANKNWKVARNERKKMIKRRTRDRRKRSEEKVLKE
jgi:hypothetical protein